MKKTKSEQWVSISTEIWYTAIFVKQYVIFRVICMILFSAKFKSLHQGHCGNSGGYLPPNTDQESIYDCRDECSSRTDLGYFAYVTGSTCACYTREGGCNYDGQHMDHNAYQILGQG